MTAIFLVPNPMHPNNRMMGVETTRQVKSVEEARRLAAQLNAELVSVR